MNIGVGMGFSIGSGHNKRWGVIMNRDADTVYYHEVYPIEIFDDGLHVKTPCYDDSNAVYPDHKDNVRLDSCPPPFTDLCKLIDDKPVKTNVYAYADRDNERHMDAFLFEQWAEIIDGGKKISDADMDHIKNHVRGVAEPEKSKKPCDFNILGYDTSDFDDYSFAVEQSDNSLNFDIC